MPALAAHRRLPRILLVEDSETSAAIVARCLAQQYDVLYERDGLHAWERLEQDADIELVISDVQMPRLDGHGLLLRIRASEVGRIRHLPVIVMTTVDNEADRQLAFNRGASDFVGKPLNPLELRARVRVHQTLTRAVRELETTQRLLQEEATIDPLTRLKNHRAFAEIGRRHLAQAHRRHRDLSLVMFDIDHFKRINDAYGHPAGDRVLADVAQTLAGSVRGGDTPARLGGEKFAILLPNTNRVGAALLAERIRLALAHRPCRLTDGSVAVTASAGVACSSEDAADNLEQLLEVADGRLYLAKQGGRNRIVAGS